MTYFLYIFLVSSIFSQSWYNHPELIWKTYETEHFIFHYHEGTENTVSEAAIVAENIYKPITDYYDFRPKTKTTIIIKDTDDYANGTAYYYDNKLEIWALPLDFDLRGSHRWLQNVITHEFTHIIQIGKSMKITTRIPAFYFQGFSYEDEKRDDVLYGYPNKMFSIPLPGVAVPPWLAEGTAQYMNPDLYYDFWDSHRDMLLRDLVINEKVLTFDEMNSFGKKGIGSEAVYNQGFSFTEYISERFGSDVLPKISNSLSKETYSINKAIYNSTGIKGYELYDSWLLNIKEKYRKNLAKVSDKNITGKIIENEGTTNLYPKFSPNSEKIAFISNKDNDYFGQTDLFVYSLKDSSSKKILSGVKYAPSWANDTSLIFSMRSKPNNNGSKYFDIYFSGLNMEEPIRLTNESRLRSPIYNSKDSLIAAVSTIDGQSNIFIGKLDLNNVSKEYFKKNSIEFIKVSNFNNLEYISSISWGENSNILMDIIKDHGRDIYSIQVDIKNNALSNVIEVFNNKNDLRNPIADNGLLYFSNDYNGVFNISYQNNNNEFKFLTNVFGGAFMPDISNEKLVYSLYSDGGYKIAIINNLVSIDEDSIGYVNPYQQELSYLDIRYNEKKLSNIKSYSTHMSDIHIVPRVQLDYDTYKYGFYMFTDDMIGKISLFSGFSMNKINDVDAFLMFDYKQFYPTLFFNFYWATRHTKQRFDYLNINDELVPNINIKNDVNYQLFSSDLGFRIPIKDYKTWFSYSYTNYKENIFQIATQEFISNGEEEIITTFGKLGFDYYRGHIFSLRAQKKAIKPHFLSNMLTNKGFILDLKISYELNNFMNGFSLNEDYGTYGAIFAPNNTWRFEFDYSYYNNYKKELFLENSFKINFISNDKIDDFFYFFGGGMPGIKGYTFYDPSLTGAGIFINSTYLRKLLIDSRYFSFKDFLGLNKLAIGSVYQFGNSYTENASNTNIVLNRRIKQSFGLELRAKGFIFYGYPIALTLEHHIPLLDKEEKKGKTYFKLLFDF